MRIIVEFDSLEEFKLWEKSQEIASKAVDAYDISRNFLKYTFDNLNDLPENERIDKCTDCIESIKKTLCCVLDD